MKKIVLLLAITSVSFINAQSFSGKGDQKFQVGGNFQENATGINASFDYGIGENMSIGVSSTYALGVKSELDADFGNRFDLNVRFNANLGNVINVDPNFDLYPGLHLGLKNFGGHLGARYFFTDGFGIYTELNAPFAKYDTRNLNAAEKLHNQFTFSLGASFNL